MTDVNQITPVAHGVMKSVREYAAAHENVGKLDAGHTLAHEAAKSAKEHAVSHEATGKPDAEHVSVHEASKSAKEHGSHKKKTRILWIDILRGLTMYLVIYGHITRYPLLQIYIYSFHMPMFFIISGMTYKFNKVKKFKTFLWNKFYALMIPYFILNLYVSPLREWLERIGEANMQSLGDLIIGVLWSNADSGYKMASNTTWFIPAIFVTVMFVFIMQKIFRTHLGMTIGTVVVVLGMYLLGQTHGTGGMWHWRVGIVAAIFYVGGYWFLYYIEPIQHFLDRLGWWMYLLCAVMLYAGYQISKYNGSCSMIRNRYHNLLLYYLSAFLTCFAIVFIIMQLSKSERFIKLMQPINFIGVNTLPYIAFQVPIMKLFWYYIPWFGTHHEPSVTVLSLMLYFGMIPLAKLVDHGIPKKKKKYDL